ncbi:MAG: putative RNA binding protein YcfA (HicA-like mRNA interferase family) [Candidatus Azotimanducaceae bacterium]|jgi:predicted RNA binding protein YcfA (HicA-like mRNA interferase family)
MKLPRNLNGADLQKALRRLGYEATRQRGSHVRITTQVNGEHHEVIPQHRPIKTKTLSSILKSISAHHNLSVEELLKEIGL